MRHKTARAARLDAALDGPADLDLGELRARRSDVAEMRDLLTRLAGLPLHRLRIEWRRKFRNEPPQGLSRDLLVRATAYKVQERSLGGLSQTAKRTLRNLASKTGIEGAGGALNRAPALTPGVRLVRDWRGQAHTVLVLEDGFEYQGQRYRSLTEIAGRITGAHWSGPRFFGLTGKRGEGRPASAERARISPVEEEADGQI